MADYDPLIPAANDLISDSQGDIQNNFTELNTLFDRDHQKWNANTSAFRGKHRKMTFPEAYTSGTVPGLGSDLGILFPQVDPNDTSSRVQLYYKNITETQQVTNRFHNMIGNQGYLMLPGGTAANKPLIIMWGNESTTGSTTKAVVFPTISNYTGAPAGFPTAVFNVQLTTALAAGDTAAKTAAIQTGSLTSTGFTLQMSASSIGDVYWYAIGN